MSATRTASFEVSANGLRGRAVWAAASAERAVRWLARNAAAPDDLFMGVREQWRRLARGSRAGRVIDRKDGATGLVLILPALPWTYRRQRPQQLARAIAEVGRHVLYLDVSIRTAVIPPPRLHVDDRGVEVLSVAVPGRPDPYTSILTPEQTAHFSDLLATGLQRRPDFILVQLPFWGPLAIELSRRLQAPLVYDRLDLHAEFPGAPALLSDAEATLASQAQHLVASSPGLCESAAAGRDWRLIPNGVVLEDFLGRDHQHRPRPEAPIAGYVGALGAWFDADAVAAAARELPAWTFQLAGHVEDDQVRALARLPNVKLLGEIPYADVPGFLSRIDVGLVPFCDLALTRAVDAVKLYEYLAAGLPVVARDLPGLMRWGPPAVYSYADSGTLAAAIRRASDEDSPSQAFGRHDLLHAETWRSRATELLAVVGQP
jgi:glycosyltransferase involved in cell wall biosynthesis